MWEEGFIAIAGREFRYEIKHFSTPSAAYGIDGGCISKLHMSMNGKDVACYDRGWQIFPSGEAEHAAYTSLLERYNSASV